MKRIAALITHVIREGEGCLPKVKQRCLISAQGIRCMPIVCVIKQISKDDVFAVRRAPSFCCIDRFRGWGVKYIK